MHRYGRAVVVLTIFGLILCETQGGRLPEKPAAHFQAAANKSNNSGVTSSYFRHDPFGPHTYAFGYEVNDERTGNVQFRDERRFVNGSVEGSFGYLRPDGRVTVTHFLVDNKRGYMSHTSTFEVGEEHAWRPHWPTAKPTISGQSPTEDQSPLPVSYDSDEHLNMTAAEMAENITKALKAQHGLDGKPDDLDEQLINPTLLDIVNGKVPLTKQAGKSDNVLGYHLVHNFIPTDFPITPFELPKKLTAESKTMQTEGDKQRVSEAFPTENGTANKTLSKYKERHDVSETAEEKPNNTVELTNPKNMHAAEVKSSQAPWYQKIIKESRKEFLENIPN